MLLYPITMCYKNYSGTFHILLRRVCIILIHLISLSPTFRQMSSL